MVAALYDHGRQAFLEGAIDWLNDDIRVVLIDTATYTVDLAAHDFLDDIAAAARVATSAADLSNKTSDVPVGGVADADDLVIASVSGASIEAFVAYVDTGNEATSQLIAYWDQNDVTGLPLTPNGGDVTIAWDSGANRIFKL